MSLLSELRRRSVIRVAASYVVAAWLVVQVVETILPAFGFGDAAVRIVVIGFAVAFIPVVVGAWVFEWTPAGIRKDDGDGNQGAAAAATARRWDRIVMIVLAVAVAFFIVDKIQERPVDVESTVAVLPFADGNPDREPGYLSIGVAEGIHTSLARIPALVVSAWPTAVELRERGVNAVEIARTLQAPNFLDGTVQKVGERIRITARLAMTDSGKTIWEETFDGSIEEIFDIQDEIAAAVVEGLRVGATGPRPTTQRTNPETYQLTMQAWAALHRIDQQNAGSVAAALLDKALALDPDYVSAMNALSFAAFLQIDEGRMSREQADAYGRDIQERVLAIDPENGLGNVYLAWDLVWERKEFAHANQHLQTALRTGLNDLEVLRVLSGLARRTGNIEAALKFSERALAVDPTCENCVWQQSENLFYARRFAEAIEVKKRLQVVGNSSYYHHAVMLLLNDQPEAALDAAADWSHQETKLPIEAMAYHALRDSDRAADRLVRLRRLDGPHQALTLAEVFAFTGDIDRAFESLDEAAQADGKLARELFLPQWDNLRDDPRWTVLRQRLGLPEEKLSMLDFSRVPPEAPGTRVHQDPGRAPL